MPGGAIPWASGSAAKTYADFEAYITAQATSGDYPWTNAIDAAATLAFRTTVDVPSGAMSGSSWGADYAFGGAGKMAALARVVQHGLPDLATLTALAGTQILVRTSLYYNGPAPALNRNGFLSANDNSNANRGKCTEILYYDPVLGPMKMNPYASSGPTPFVIP